MQHDPSSEQLRAKEGHIRDRHRINETIPIIFIGVIVLVIVGWVRRVRREAVGGATVSGGSTGHWAGGQHVGSDSGTAAAGAGGPWARAPGTATSGGGSDPQGGLTPDLEGLFGFLKPDPAFGA